MKCETCKDRRWNDLKGDIRLNLGSRSTRIDGYLNMDCDRHENVDMVGDVGNLSMFCDGRVSDIHASHILEHFPHTETRAVLGEWYRVLKNGGKLYLAVPDFKRAVEIYLKDGLSDWVENFLCGDQGYRTAFHYAIFDQDRLDIILRAEKFRNIEFVEDLPVRQQGDCSQIYSNIDGKPVSLNVVATK